MQSLADLQTQYNEIVNASLPYHMGRDAVKAKLKENRAKLRVLESAIAQHLPLEPGMFFYEMWGYDQTNIDYLEVIEVSPTRKTVLCRMVGKKIVESPQPQGDYKAPDNSYRGPTLFRMKVSAFRDGLTLKGEYPFCEHYFLSCRLAEANSMQGCFKCPKYADSNNYELSNYFMWSQGAKEARCKGCEHCFNKLCVDWREGSFSKYDKPMYETDPMFGH